MILKGVTLNHLVRNDSLFKSLFLLRLHPGDSPGWMLTPVPQHDFPCGREGRGSSSGPRAGGSSSLPLYSFFPVNFT